MRRSLELVWTNECAVDFSWSGQRLNVAVRDFKIIAIIRDMARIRYNVHLDKFESINILLKKWFFYAGQRAKPKASNSNVMIRPVYDGKKKDIVDVKVKQTDEQSTHDQSAVSEEYLDYDESQEERDELNHSLNTFESESVPSMGIKRKADDQSTSHSKEFVMKVNRDEKNKTQVVQKLSKISKYNEILNFFYLQVV